MFLIPQLTIILISSPARQRPEMLSSYLQEPDSYLSHSLDHSTGFTAARATPVITLPARQ